MVFKASVLLSIDLEEVLQKLVFFFRMLGAKWFQSHVGFCACLRYVLGRVIRRRQYRGFQCCCGPFIENLMI